MRHISFVVSFLFHAVGSFLVSVNNSSLRDTDAEVAWMIAGSSATFHQSVDLLSRIFELHSNVKKTELGNTPDEDGIASLEKGFKTIVKRCSECLFDKLRPSVKSQSAAIRSAWAIANRGPEPRDVYAEIYGGYDKYVNQRMIQLNELKEKSDAFYNPENPKFRVQYSRRNDMIKMVDSRSDLNTEEKKVEKKRIASNQKKVLAQREAELKAEAASAGGSYQIPFDLVYEEFMMRLRADSVGRQLTEIGTADVFEAAGNIYTKLGAVSILEKCLIDVFEREFSPDVLGNKIAQSSSTGNIYNIPIVLRKMFDVVQLEQMIVALEKEKPADDPVVKRLASHLSDLKALEGGKEEKKAAEKAAPISDDEKDPILVQAQELRASINTDLRWRSFYQSRRDAGARDIGPKVEWDGGAKEIYASLKAGGLLSPDLFPDFCNDYEKVEELTQQITAKQQDLDEHVGKFESSGFNVSKTDAWKIMAKYNTMCKILLNAVFDMWIPLQ